MRDVDVVVEDVVVAQVVFVVEAAARGQLAGRRVERDVAVRLRLESDDVLGLARSSARRSACRSGACATSARKSPAGGSSDQSSRLRSLRSTLNDFGAILRRNTSSRRAAQSRASARASRARRGRRAGSKSDGLRRTNADVERRLQRLAAAEDPDLALLGVRRRAKTHLAAAQQHQPGDAVVACRRRRRCLRRA